MDNIFYKESMNLDWRNTAPGRKPYSKWTISSTDDLKERRF